MADSHRRLSAQVLFRFGNACRLKNRWKLASTLIGLITKLEGGEVRSVTARELLSKWYDIEVGLYSYGAPFRPGLFTARTRIGRYCSIAGNVRVVERNHPYDRLSTSSYFYDPRLESSSRIRCRTSRN